MERISIKDLKNQSILADDYKNIKAREHLKKVIMNRKYKSKGGWTDDMITRELIKFGFIQS